MAWRQRSSFFRLHEASVVAARVVTQDVVVPSVLWLEFPIVLIMGGDDGGPHVGEPGSRSVCYYAGPVFRFTR